MRESDKMIRLLTRVVEELVQKRLVKEIDLLKKKRVELVDQYTNDDVRDNVEIHYEEVFVYDVREEDEVDHSLTLEVRVTSDDIVIVITHDDIIEQLLCKTL
jgi:hypothetical protein